MAEAPEVEGFSDLVLIAKGGFGTVYRARQVRHGRVVALKVLDVSDLDERGRRRFDRECVAMGSLSWHPNVVALFDSGIAADGHPWLAMEYLEAGSLGDRLRKDGPLPWPAAVVAGVQVAGALGAAHAAGVLHRDLKPENLLIGPFGEVELGDFGIAAVEGASKTTTGHASFTASHVAPEILRRQRPDERADLYSLASTLHTLVAGSPPFAGRAGEPIEAVLASVLTDPPPRLQGVPASLADLLHQTLSKDPGDRPASAEVFGRILQRVQAEGGHDVTELRLAPTGRLADPVEPPPSVDSDTGPVAAAGGDSRTTVHELAPAGGEGDPLPTVTSVPSPPSAPGEPAPAALLSGDGSVAPDPRRGPPGGGLGPRRRRTVAAAVLGGAALVVAILFVVTGDAGDRSSNTTAAETTTVTEPPTTDVSSGVTTVGPADLPVLVVNATGVPGMGSVVVADLQSAGYGVDPPQSDSPASSTAGTTLVYYFVDDSVSYQAEAEAVADVVGVRSAAVTPMPADVAAGIVDVEENAAVLVLLGEDFPPQR